MRKGIPANLFALGDCCRTCFRDDHASAEHDAWEAAHRYCPICFTPVPNDAECPCRAIAREQQERDIRRKNRRGAERHARALRARAERT